MKKIILPTLALTIFFVQASGQIGFGLKGGINLANAKEAGSNGNTYRAGFNAGGLARFMLSKKIGVEPELLYSVKGYGLPSTPFSGSDMLSLNYISVPALVAFHAGKKFSVLAGPEIGFLVNAKLKVDGNKYDVSEYYRKFDAGIDLGIRYIIIKGLGAELRYSHGLIDIADAERTDNAGNQIANYRVGGNRTFQFDLLYIFSVKE